MPDKRPWRKELKKQQRKRKRRKAAEARDLQLEEEEANKLNDPAHQYFVQQQARLAEEQLLEAKRRHAQEEEAWLRRDLLTHREFRLKQQQREAAEAGEVAKRKQQEEELAAKLAAEQSQRKEQERRQAAAAAEFEKMMEHMESFLNNTGPAPIELRRWVESRPGESVCALYERTNCCRYGARCINNHRRPLLAKIIVVRHFFIHPLLEEEMHKEYASADGSLELNEQDLCDAYNDFFADVMPELEEFGLIRNFRAIRNVSKHLRGHVFIEYVDERAALKAFIKLQGRFYAGKQLNVEFSNITMWESAVCGLEMKHKCQRGKKCYYLHLLKNPGNKYSTPLVMMQTTSYKTVTTTPLLSWEMVTSGAAQQKLRNWRWSESPELEILSTANIGSENSEKNNQREDNNDRNKNDLSGNKNVSHTTQSVESNRSSERMGEQSDHLNKGKSSASKSEKNSLPKYPDHSTGRKNSSERRDDVRGHERSSSNKYKSDSGRSKERKHHKSSRSKRYSSSSKNSKRSERS